MMIRSDAFGPGSDFSESSTAIQEQINELFCGPLHENKLFEVSTRTSTAPVYAKSHSEGMCLDWCRVVAPYRDLLRCQP